MAGSIVVTSADVGGVLKYTIVWTSDASGVVSANTFDVRYGELRQVKFIPGAGGVAPTALYDVTVTDPDGVDILAGSGADLSATAAAIVIPHVNSDRLYLEAQTLTPVVANAGNAKSGTIILLIAS